MSVCIHNRVENCPGCLIERMTNVVTKLREKGADGKTVETLTRLIEGLRADERAEAVADVSDSAMTVEEEPVSPRRTPPRRGERASESGTPAGWAQRPVIARATAPAPVNFEELPSLEEVLHIAQSPKRKRWTEEQEQAIRAGFARYGCMWEKMRTEFLQLRVFTGQQLKDKARNLKLR